MPPAAHTPTASSIADPVGPDGLTLQTLRQIAERHQAISFIERQPTDASDQGTLVNPTDCLTQAGIATYQLSDETQLVHYLASFWPHEIPHSPGAPTTYNNVLEIMLPYNVPHVIIYPRLREGVLATLLSGSGQPLFDPKVATRVQLEGNFSEFIDAYAPPGEDVSVFTYLAPNIMELILTRVADFSIEFIGNHIYVVFLPRRAVVGIEVSSSVNTNTYFTPQLHEVILQLGLEIGSQLARAARPLKQAAPPTTKIPRPSMHTIINQLFSPLSLLTMPWRFARETKRLQRFHSRYGTNQLKF